MTVLPPAITQVLQKLWCSSSKFWNLQRFQICAARPPQAVARAVVHVRVGAAPLSLQLGLTLRTVATTQVSHKLCLPRVKKWGPQRFHICAARLPQAVARAVADVRVAAAPLSLKLGLTLLSPAPMQVSHKLWFSSSKFGNPQRFQISAARLPQAVARAGAHVRAGALPCSPPLWFARLRFVTTRCYTFFVIFKFSKWDPSAVPDLRHAAASRSCARGLTCK